MSCERCAQLEQLLSEAHAAIATLGSANAELAKAAVEASTKALSRVRDPGPSDLSSTPPSIGQPGLYSPQQRDLQKARALRLAGDRPQPEAPAPATQAAVEARFAAPDTPAAT